MAAETRVETAQSAAQAGALPAQKREWNWGTFGRYVGVAVVLFFAVAPFYWTVSTSLKNGLELYSSPPTLYPHNPTLANYHTDVANTPYFTRDLLNSAIVAACTTVLCILIGILCAYAIARLKFRGKGLVLAIVLSVMVFPVIVLVGPLFVIFTGTHLYNTYAALIIPDLVLTLPLTVWFLTSFFRDLPPDLEEAALVDGDTRLGALRHVIFPLAAPGVFTTAILAFIYTWNDFLFGLTLTSDPNGAQPVTVAITLFGGEHSIPWGEIAGAAVIVTIPLVILVLLFQRRIVSGLTAGAVKG